MKGLFSENAKQIITRYTTHLFSAILAGTILTILLGSSSAVIILVIVFINAQNLSFRQGIGLIMGANIGTTFSSQIISFDIGRYAIIPLCMGLAFEVLAKQKRKKQLGQVLLYFGMLFFGLFLMESSVEPLKSSPIFENWLARINENYIQGSLIGGLITLIIQSSSGTVGIAIVLGKQEMISIAGGIAVMLGAELGTCSDTLIATINGSRQAIKAGLFHLLFNFSTIILGLILFYPFVAWVDFISASDDIGRQIANAHMLFNIMGVIVFLPVVGFAERMLNKMIPEKKGISHSSSDSKKRRGI